MIRACVVSRENLRVMHARRESVSRPSRRYGVCVSKFSYAHFYPPLIVPLYSLRVRACASRASLSTLRWMSSFRQRNYTLVICRCARVFATRSSCGSSRWKVESSKSNLRTKIRGRSETIVRKVKAKGKERRKKRGEMIRHVNSLFFWTNFRPLVRFVALEYFFLAFVALLDEVLPAFSTGNRESERSEFEEIAAKRAAACNWRD